jgi:hypothetical protein
LIANRQTSANLRIGNIVSWVYLSVFSFALASNAMAQRSAPTLSDVTIEDTKLTALKGNTHALARPEFDRGPAPADLPLNRMLLLLRRSPQQEIALKILLDQQQDKFSLNYHAWLTPQQFGQQFGPSDLDIRTVKSWLESYGFQINRVANGRVTIEFSGTAGQVKRAFHTEIHKYAVNGKERWANSADPQIPTALAPLIAGIATLHNFPRKPLHRLVGVFSKGKNRQSSRLVRSASATTLMNPLATSGVLGGVVGRWVPVVGEAILVVQGGNFVSCLWASDDNY